MLKQYCVVRGTTTGYEGLRIISKAEHNPYREEVICDSNNINEAKKLLEEIIEKGVQKYISQFIEKENIN